MPGRGALKSQQREPSHAAVPSRAGRGAQGCEDGPPGGEGRGPALRVPRTAGAGGASPRVVAGVPGTLIPGQGAHAGARGGPETPAGARRPAAAHTAWKGPSDPGAGPTHRLRRAPRAAGRPEGAQKRLGAARALSALVLSRARGCGPTPELPGGPFTVKTRAGCPRLPPEGGPAPIKTYPPDLSRQPTPKPRSTATARPRVPATRLHPVTCRGVSAQPWGDGTGSPSRSQGPQQEEGDGM